MTIRIEDTKWVRGVFGLAPARRDRRAMSRPKTSADLKFGDTTFGGNAAINPPPQFTRFADLKATGLFARTDQREANWNENEFNSGSFRQGRFYSEVHDDNAQYLHLRFGIPKYTGVLPYFTNMYNADLARVANTGDYTSILRTAGKIGGLYVMFMVLPMAVFIPLIIGSKMVGYAMSAKPSRYYYLKPTPHLYLQAVQAMADVQLLYHKLVPIMEPIWMDRFSDIEDRDNSLSSRMSEVYSALPDIWKSNGKFDVFKAVNRYQVLANYQARTLKDIYDSSRDEKEYLAKLNAYVKRAQQNVDMKNQVNSDDMSLYNLAMAFAKNPLYQVDEEGEAAMDARYAEIKSRFDSAGGVSGNDIVAEQEQGADSAASPTTAPEEQTNQSFWGSAFSDIAEQYSAEIMEGGHWITFKVDAKNTSSDSFSNSTREPEISSTLNSITSKARSLEINTSGGNTGIGFVDEAIKGVKAFLGGALDTLNLGFLMGIYGTAYADIPDVWDSSSAQFNSESFTIQLRSPYGNDLAIFQNITLPLCFILSSVLPIATGKQSHTSPFLCEAYSRGRFTSRLSIVESVSLQRGTGNLGWRSDGKMLACDVTITLKDLSRVMAMPIIKSPNLFDSDSVYTDYMATLGGASLQELTTISDKVILSVNKWLQSTESFFMTGRIASSAGAMLPSRILSLLAGSTAR